jgi:MFS family permease
MTTQSHSVLDSPRGKRVLAVLCAVAFLDFVDASITNVALPHIRTALGFSLQTLQWVPSAYLLSYGGLILLGGRLADLFGRRRILLVGTALLAVGSLVGGLAGSSGVFVGARLGQGLGAALMLPAALSTLTTTFTVPAPWGSGEPSPGFHRQPESCSAACSWRALAGAGSCSSTRSPAR